MTKLNYIDPKITLDLVEAFNSGILTRQEVKQVLGLPSDINIVNEIDTKQPENICKCGKH